MKSKLLIGLLLISVVLVAGCSSYRDNYKECRHPEICDPLVVVVIIILAIGILIWLEGTVELVTFYWKRRERKGKELK